MDTQLTPPNLRPALVRILIAMALAVLVLLPMAASAASAPRKYAGIVIDAKSGKVLYESSADAARYPASVTKVMTLYILFQELNAGNIKLTDKMVVSKHAAAAVPTKLGLRSGSKIAVKDAILSLVTLSANDMARVIAEHISGTESAFAKRMTATAKALGMNNTTYRNASGLPDSRQVTTVHDQAILGIAIYQHFPKYYEFFQTKSFSYGKRTYGNHNRLLGYMDAVDGIKTGWTRASGSTLLTAARKNNRHIVVAAFGFNSSASRDAKVRELVKKYLSKGRRGDYLRTALIPMPGRKGSVRVAVAEPVTPMPYPTFRNVASMEAMHMPDRPDPEAVRRQLANPVIVASVNPIPAPAARPQDIGLAPAVQAANMMGGSTASSMTPDPQDRPLDVIGAWLSDTLSLGAAPAPLGQTAPSAPLVPPVGIGDGGRPVDLMISNSIGVDPVPVENQPMPAPIQVAAAEPVPQPAASGWVVQIGAAPTEQGAHTLLSSATGSVTTLNSFKPYVERFEKNGQVFYRARFAGFGSSDDAVAMCSQLSAAEMSCLAMQS